jgi:hypothetical protein
MTACNYLHVVEHSEALDQATGVLYSTPPDDFLAKRTELVAEAKRQGDTATAQAIGRLRKPTVAAWIVNAYARANPELITQLTDIGDQLRVAQDSLQVDQLRALSGERRSLTAGLAKDALRHAGRAAASTALHDEVASTFDAAVADPAVAASLGSLQHGEQFSGFGFGAAPALTLVQGGRTPGGAPRSAQPAANQPSPKQPPPPPPKRPAAEQRRLDQAVRVAQRTLDTVDARLDDAQGEERSATATLRALEQQLEDIRRQIGETRSAIEDAKQRITQAKAERRDAATALRRAEQAAAR